MISANQNLMYPIAILLSTETKKTCSSLARTIEIREDLMWRLLKDNCEMKNELKAILSRVFGDAKNLFLIIDDTSLSKIHSKYIEGSSKNFNSSNNTTEWGLCSIVAMVSDGKIALPIALRNWVQQEIAQDAYQSKVELAQELIEEVIQEIHITIIVMDGLFARQEMMQWLNEHNLKFEMRMHANRVVESENGESAQLRNHTKLRLRGRQLAKTIRINWKNMWLQVTTIKRFNKNGNFQIIYQVSNYNALPKKHQKNYAYRWNIEKFFRTAKQHLGFAHCQSRKLDLQINHQLNVFLAYAILQLEQQKRKLRSPEESLKRLKKQNYTYIEHRISSFHQIFSKI